MRQHRLRGHLARLEEELERLRAENTRLRLERERDVGLHRAIQAARRIRAARPENLDPDDAWQALIETRVVRNELLFLCQELRLAVTFLERQLHALAPAPELDRRTTDRRSADRPPESVSWPTSEEVIR
jgi:hypothetical protein